MSRTLVLVATAALLGALSAAPAEAQLWGSRRAADQAAAPATPAAQPHSSASRAASAEERAAYDRLDPLVRSAFWAGQREIDPLDAGAGLKLAEALRELGQFDKAVEAAESVLVSHPDNLEARLEVGRSHIARGQAFYGIRRLEEARDRSPRDWRPLSLLGVAYQQVSRHDEARAAWNAGLTLSPDNPHILTNAAMAQATAGDPAGAEILLRRAVAHPGADLKIRLNLALILGLQGKASEAEQIIRRELPPEQAERNLAWLRAQTGGATAGQARTWGSLEGR